MLTDFHLKPPAPTNADGTRDDPTQGDDASQAEEQEKLKSAETERDWEHRRQVAEAPWSEAEWAVALRFDIPRSPGCTSAGVRVTVLGFQTP